MLLRYERRFRNCYNEIMKNKKQLSEVRIVLQRLEPGEKALLFDDLHSGDALGKRSKLGGKPDWIQSPEETMCQYCQEEMTFIAQIDSIDDSAQIDYSEAEYMFEDVGMLYIFYCFECGETATFCQGY